MSDYSYIDTIDSAKLNQFNGRNGLHFHSMRGGVLTNGTITNEKCVVSNFQYLERDKNLFKYSQQTNGITDLEDPIFTGFTIVFDFNDSILFDGIINNNYINFLNNSLDSDMALSKIIQQSLVEKNKKLHQENISQKSLNTVGTISGKYIHEYYHPGYGAIDYLFMQDRYVPNQINGGSNTLTGGTNNLLNSMAVLQKYDNQIKKLEADNMVKTNLRDIKKTQIEENDELQQYYYDKSFEQKDEESWWESLKNKAKDAVGLGEPDPYENFKGCKKNNESLCRDYDELENIILENNKSIDSLKRERQAYLDRMNSLAAVADEANENLTDEQRKNDFAPLSCINLVKFVSNLHDISTYSSHMFQSVEGLDEAYNIYFDENNTAKNSGDNSITVNCLESIDLKISGMFNRYFNAIYDRQYKRFRVPSNLRKFNVSIYVHDVRNFRNIYTETGKVLTQLMLNDDIKKSNVVNGTGALTLDTNILSMIADHLSVVEFKFFDCEFIPSGTGNIFSSINNSEGSNVATKFSFNYSDCSVNFVPHGDISSMFGIYNSEELLETISPYNILESNVNESVPSPIKISGLDGNVLEEDIYAGRVKQAINSLVGYGIRAVSNNERSAYGTIERSINKTDKFIYGNDETPMIKKSSDYFSYNNVDLERATKDKFTYKKNKDTLKKNNFTYKKKMLKRAKTDKNEYKNENFDYAKIDNFSFGTANLEYDKAQDFDYGITNMDTAKVDESNYDSVDLSKAKQNEVSYEKEILNSAITDSYEYSEVDFDVHEQKPQTYGKENMDKANVNKNEYMNVNLDKTTVEEFDYGNVNNKNAQKNDVDIKNGANINDDK